MLFAIFGALLYLDLLPGIDNLVHDNIMVQNRPVAENIVIVGVDERSLNEIGTWPWPRFFMAEAIERLTEMGAAVIGINVLYDTHGAVPEYDARLVEAAAATDRLVLGGMGILSHIQNDPDFLTLEYYVLPFGDLASVANVGFLNIASDEDGVLRRSLNNLRFGDIIVNSFPFEVYRIYRQTMGQPYNYEIPLDSDGQFPINFVSGPGNFTSLSLWGVINEEYPSSIFQDAIVLIGPYAPGVGDGNFLTPLNRSVSTYGIEIYANIIQNLLEDEFKQDAPLLFNLGIMAFLALVFIFAVLRLKPALSLAATLGLVAVVLIAAWLFYGQMFLITSVGYSILFLLLCYLVNLVLGVIITTGEKQHIQGLFGRFVAPEVVRQILDSGIELQLGGTLKDVSLVFVDIRGFTAFSETNPPEIVVEMVNRYLGLTSRSIQENGGTIDKYIGDATMAIFNAPNDVPNHALSAVKAAWAMKQGSITLREEILRDYGVDLQFGVGINSGPAVIGNMGSDFRMDYTAIGDTVNTAARLESASKGGQIIISDATYQQVKDHVEVEDLGLLNVKNKAVGIQIYSVEGIK